MIRNRNKSAPVPESVMIPNMDVVLMEHHESSAAAVPRSKGRSSEGRRGSHVDLTTKEAQAPAAATNERTNTRRKRRSQKGPSRDDTTQSLKEHSDSADATTWDTRRPSLPNLLGSHHSHSTITSKTEECNSQEGGNVLMEQSDQDVEELSMKPNTRVTHENQMPLSELAGLLIALQAPSQHSKPK